MRFVLGLTGVSGAGKSVAAEHFKKRGAFVIDADKISRDITKKGGIAVPEIEKAFPEAVTDGVIDRKKLGSIVFNDSEKLKILNKITHKYIMKIIKELAEPNNGFIVIDAPVLYEAGADALCDKVMVIDAPDEVKIKRIMARDNIDRARAKERIAARNAAALREKADVTVVNDSDEASFFSKLDNFLKGNAIIK